MGRFLTPTGEETNDEAAAATDEQGNPVQNQTRNLWVTATALTTALNTAFLAERIALFAIVMGVALLLTLDRLHGADGGRRPPRSNGTDVADKLGRGTGSGCVPG